MRAYVFKAGITGAFFIFIYIMIYTSASWGSNKSSPGELPSQEVMNRKLERIEHALVKLGECEEQLFCRQYEVYKSTLKIKFIITGSYRNERTQFVCKSDTRKNHFAERVDSE